MSADLHWALGAAILIAAGLGSGFAGGLFGIGGGILRVPIFIYLFPLFGVEPSALMHLAAGTSLALSVPSSLQAGRAQQRAGNVDRDILRVWMPSLLVGVCVGLAIANVVSGRTLIGMFAVLMFGIGVQMVRGERQTAERQEPPKSWILAPLAAVIGAAATMIGVVGGAFATAGLSSLGVPIHRAIAIASVGGIGVGAVAAVGSVYNGWDVAGRAAYSLGYVDLPALVLMGPAVMFAAPRGVRLANRLDAARLKRLFGVFLLLIAADMARVFATGP